MPVVPMGKLGKLNEPSHDFTFNMGKNQETGDAKDFVDQWQKLVDKQGNMRKAKIRKTSFPDQSKRLRSRLNSNDIDLS